jgi:hypothetical protein
MVFIEACCGSIPLARILDTFAARVPAFAATTPPEA